MKWDEFSARLLFFFNCTAGTHFTLRNIKERAELRRRRRRRRVWKRFADIQTTNGYLFCLSVAFLRGEREWESYFLHAHTKWPSTNRCWGRAMKRTMMRRLKIASRRRSRRRKRGRKSSPVLALWFWPRLSLWAVLRATVLLRDIERWNSIASSRGRSCVGTTERVHQTPHGGTTGGFGRGLGRGGGGWVTH